MPSLLDYVATNGQRTFHTSPFNDIDVLVFARFIFLPFKTIKIAPEETVGTLAQKLLAKRQAKFFWDDKKLIQAMSKSSRYCNLKVTDFSTKFNEKTAEQFSAISVHLSPTEIFIAFIGTDDTAAGWREDFNMSFMDEVPAQKSARRYLRNILKKYPTANLRLGGHSKGGNLAMTSILAVNPKNTTRILSVHSLDGPGFSAKIAKKLKKHPLFPLLVNYAPQDSLVGRLFLHVEPYEVIKSSADNAFFEHNLYTWTVDLEVDQLVTAEFSAKSDANDRMLKKWTDGASEKQKRVFIDVLFKLLAISNYENPTDIAAGGLKTAFPNLLNSYRKLDKSDRKIIFRALRKLIFAAFIANKRSRKISKSKQKGTK